jgi:hypothetical protein
MTKAQIKELLDRVAACQGIDLMSRFRLADSKLVRLSRDDVMWPTLTEAGRAYLEA